MTAPSGKSQARLAPESDMAHFGAVLALRFGNLARELTFSATSGLYVRPDRKSGMNNDKTGDARPRDIPYLDSPFVALRSASRAVTQLYDLVLSPTGLKASQFDTLRTIAAYGKVKQCELARAYARAPETLSRSLSSLRMKGLIELQLDRVNREQAYAVTRAGKQLLEAAAPCWQHAETRLQKTLGDVESVLLSRIAIRTVEAAREAEHLRLVRDQLSPPSKNLGSAAVRVPQRKREQPTDPPFSS